MDLLSSTIAQLLHPLSLVALGAGLVVSVAVYRVWLSPLSHVPGPKLAALTLGYQLYWDMVRGGQYVWKVREMHERYGPVVRISPDVVHVSDPSFLAVLYTQNPKVRRERHWTLTEMFGVRGSMLATGPHDVHRKRRASVNPLFSQSAVRALEPIVLRSFADLMRRMDGWAADGRPVKMMRGLRAATKDIIHSYCFGDDGGPRFLEMDDCNEAFFMVLEPNGAVWIRLVASWLVDGIESIPPSLLKTIMPYLGGFVEMGQGLKASVEAVRASKEPPERRTIFHEMLSSPHIPESEKRTKRMSDEAVVLIVAGTDTTATTMRGVLFHLLSDRALFGRARAEVEAALPDPNQPPSIAKVHNLPLLNAIIDEVIRFHPGATHRQVRSAPDEDLVYTTPDGKTSYAIPRGCGMAMSAPLINRHPDLYDRPDEFNPDRFLRDPSLTKHLFSFSKGARQCIGIHLAYQTLQIFTAGILRKYHMYDPSLEKQKGPTLELYETTFDDIVMHGDFVTPGLRPGSQNLRIMIRN